MAVRKGEHVLILTDRETLEVGEAIPGATENLPKGNVQDSHNRGLHGTRAST